MYFLTCSITGWIDLFSRQVYRDIVLDSWRFCRQHKNFQIHAYTFMTNHLHLIASCRPPYHLSDTMRDWKAFTARQIVLYLQDYSNTESRRESLLYLFSYFALGKKHKQTHQIWQEDNYPVELYSADFLEQKLNYIHLNAVRAGWVEKPEDWKYSSAPFYAAEDEKNAGTELPLIEITPVWAWFYENE